MVLPLLAAALPALIGAGGSIIGGMIGKQAQQEGFERESQLQKDFAQQGIRWRVEDAKAAGLHPLAALGAQLTQYSPVGLGQNDALASGVAAAGQDVGRAVDATRTAAERASAYETSLRQLTLTRAELENQLLVSQIRRMNQVSSPGLPSVYDPYFIPGQPGSGTKVLPMPEGVQDWKVGPGVPAEVIETEYGDFAQELYGLPKFVADSLRYNWANRDRQVVYPAGGYVSDIVAP